MTSPGRLTLALIHDVFCEPGGVDRLAGRLEEARAAGAELALLPELPLHGWLPPSTGRAYEDAEPQSGPRHEAQGAAARRARIGLVGGAISIDAASGERRNRAFVFDAEGREIGWYDKLHIPNEEGFWEAAHYTGGSRPPSVIEGFGLRIGLQICSDLFPPDGLPAPRNARRRGIVALARRRSRATRAGAR